MSPGGLHSVLLRHPDRLISCSLQLTPYVTSQIECLTSRQRSSPALCP